MRGGGRKRLYAGRDVLHEVRRHKIQAKVIVVTQYETFGQGSQRRTLVELRQELGEEFAGTYLGTVYYYPSRSDWRTELSKLLRRAGIKPATE